MKISRRTKRLFAIAMLIAMLGSLGLITASTQAVVDQELLYNGSFENGFSHADGCGTVGTGWGCFTNGGTVDYGFFDDQWAPVVADGLHSQLIELNTLQYAASESDRYAGIYQSVDVVTGANYQFKVTAGIRERNPDSAEDAFRYRVQWGYTTNGSTDWTQVTNWVELPTDKIDDRTAPTGLTSYSTTFTAPSSRITIFVRAWKKWGTAYKDVEFNIDAVSLFGMRLQAPFTPAGSVVVLPGTTITSGSSSTTTSSSSLSCGGNNYVYNGNFESGFSGGVGNGWTAYTNGGAASYGFYDDTWAPTLKDGSHSQLIEINTLGQIASDANRVAGVYTIISGLTPGATYQFSASGMMRERYDHSNEDAYRYRVQWGFAALDGSPSQDDITNWVELSWNQIYLRTSPGAVSDYTATFTAPSSQIVLGVQALKKWATGERELDVNIDAISVVGCAGAAYTGQTYYYPSYAQTGACVYTVVRGDSLSRIAASYGSTVATLAEWNRIPNPNILYVGQQLTVPCANSAITVLPQSGQVVVLPEPTQEIVVLPATSIGDSYTQPTTNCTWYTVVSGDTLYGGRCEIRYDNRLDRRAEQPNQPQLDLQWAAALRDGILKLR